MLCFPLRWASSTNPAGLRLVLIDSGLNQPLDDTVIGGWASQEPAMLRNRMSTEDTLTSFRKWEPAS